jgi:hypothetical protein
MGQISTSTGMSEALVWWMGIMADEDDEEDDDEDDEEEEEEEDAEGGNGGAVLSSPSSAATPGASVAGPPSGDVEVEVPFFARGFPLGHPFLWEFGTMKACSTAKTVREGAWGWCAGWGWDAGWGWGRVGVR